MGTREETIARPTALIMHNKIRLAYKERRDIEWEKPEPPGADFARNGQDSGVQDLLHIDLKVRSEHRLCGKQYDAEMQQYYLHKFGNLEAVSILIDADGEFNEHFQLLLDYFQEKFDRDARLCKLKQRGARALFEEKVKARRRSKLRRAREGRDSASVEDSEYEQELIEEQDGYDNPSSSNSTFYQRVHDRFLSLLRRREKRTLIWDPLLPDSIYRTIWFWAYSGSTTEPPCFEDVKWRVHDVPMRIKKLQYIQLKKLMFDHVDPDTCRMTSTHFEESNARPVQPYKGGALYRCRRTDYVSDKERELTGKRKGFNQRQFWKGVDLLPFVDPEFPDV